MTMDRSMTVRGEIERKKATAVTKAGLKVVTFLNIGKLEVAYVGESFVKAGLGIVVVDV